MIICEIGLNHMGDENEAKSLTLGLLKSKINAITFQVRENDFYKKGKNQKLILPETFYHDIVKIIKNSGLKIGIALAEETKIDFFERLDVDFYKILSKDLENYNLIKKIKRTKKPIFISTGMSDLSQIEKLVQFVSHEKQYFTLIHTQLSHNIDDVNLEVISLLKRKFEIPVAYGHHSINPYVLFLSLAFKPSDIFFYVKRNTFENYPDNEHAINLDDLSFYLENLEELQKSLGSKNKLKMKNLINENFEI